MHKKGSTVMNDSPDNREKIQRRPGGRVEHWDYRQNTGAMGAPGSNSRKDSPDEPKWTHQKPAEAIVRGESAGIVRATRGKAKWQGNGTGDSPVYIKFSYIM